MRAHSLPLAPHGCLIAHFAQRRGLVVIGSVSSSPLRGWRLHTRVPDISSAFPVIKLWSSGSGSSSDGRAPLSKYWGVSVTNTIGPTMGIEALKYINYPAQVWFRLLLPSHLGCYMHCPGHCVMLMLGSCRGHMGNIVTDAYGLRCSDRVN